MSAACLPAELLDLGGIQVISPYNGATVLVIEQALESIETLENDGGNEELALSQSSLLQLSQDLWMCVASQGSLSSRDLVRMQCCGPPFTGEFIEHLAHIYCT